MESQQRDARSRCVAFPRSIRRATSVRIISGRRRRIKPNPLLDFPAEASLRRNSFEANIRKSPRGNSAVSVHAYRDARQSCRGGSRSLLESWSNARRLHAQLNAMNIPRRVIAIQTASGSRRWRVVAGPFPDEGSRAGAKRARGKSLSEAYPAGLPARHAGHRCGLATARQRSVCGRRHYRRAARGGDEQYLSTVWNAARTLGIQARVSAKGGTPLYPATVSSPAL